MEASDAQDWDAIDAWSHEVAGLLAGDVEELVARGKAVMTVSAGSPSTRSHSRAAFRLDLGEHEPAADTVNLPIPQTPVLAP